jgi:hypothetical protein
MLYKTMTMLNLIYPFDHISFMSMTNVFSSVFSCLVIELKGKWSIRQRRRFHSTPSYYLLFAGTPHRSSLWYNLHSKLIVCQRVRESKGLIFHSIIRFWRFMSKGERALAQSKRTAPPPISKNVVFYLILKEVFSISILF